MSTVQITGFQPQVTWPYLGSTATLRYQYSADFIDSAGQAVLRTLTQDVTCTVAGGVLSVPTHNIISTLDALVNPLVTLSAQFLDQSGARRTWLFTQFSIPTTTPTTIGALTIFNQGSSLVLPPDSYLNAQEVQNLISIAQGTLNDASDVIKGRTKLSAAPISPSDPIAVGQNVMPVNVKDAAYGVVGDGVTNDRAALQAAITAAVALGRNLYIPAGTYKVTVDSTTKDITIPSSLTIFGDGPGRTIINVGPNPFDTIHQGLFRVTATTVETHIYIRDLTINGPATANVSEPLQENTFAIRWQGAGVNNINSTLTVENVSTAGQFGNSISWSGKAKRVRVLNCDLVGWQAPIACFESSFSHNMTLEVSGGRMWGDTATGDNDSIGIYVHPHIDIVITGVTFQSFGRWAIYQNGSSGSAIPRVSLIQGCTMIDCGMAQTTSNGHTTIDGCTVTGTVSNGSSVLIRESATVSNCHFNTANSAPITCLQTTTHRVTIVGCTWENLGAGLTAILLGTGGIPIYSIRACEFHLSGGVCLTCTSTTAIMEIADCLLNGSGAAAGQWNISGGTYAFRNVRGGQYFLGANIVTVDISDCRGCLIIPEFNPINTLSGGDNDFLGSAIGFTGTPGVALTTNQQRLTRRPGVNPTAVASATTIDLFTQALQTYDTHNVTGSAAIANLAGTGFIAFAGILRLIVATGGTWSTANSGNITPLTTAARTAGTVVTLLWDGISKWLEV